MARSVKTKRSLHWKRLAAHLYHVCWLIILAILFCYCILITEPNFPQLLLRYSYLWFFSLLLLFCCLLVIYLYIRKVSRLSRNKGDVIVMQALALQDVNTRKDYLIRIIRELRTALTAIRNTLPAAERDYTPRYIKAIKHASRYASRLVNKALKYDKGAAVTPDHPAAEPILLSEWLTNILKIQLPVANKKGVILKGGVDEVLPNYILAPRKPLTQMLVNLTNKAIMHSPPNKDVLVACYAHGSTLNIQVSNAGKSPAPHELFQPALKEEGVAKAGSPLLQHLADLTGSSITAEYLSESDRTTICCALPLRSPFGHGEITIRRG